MTLNTIYLICAIAGGTILVLRIILTVIGLDHGADAVDTVDVGHGDVGHVELGGGPRWRRHWHEPALSAIHRRLLHHVWPGGPGPAASPTGPHLEPIGRAGRRGITAWATGMIFFQMGRLQSEGTMVISDAIGQVGTVYLTIPEKGTGVVTVTVQGTLRNLDAVSENGRRIPTGAMVRVVSITAGKILVVAEQSADPS